jgi:hypothetical protein
MLSTEVLCCRSRTILDQAASSEVYPLFGSPLPVRAFLDELEVTDVELSELGRSAKRVV